jgi:Eukaryotic aspartyl protease
MSRFFLSLVGLTLCVSLVACGGSGKDVVDAGPEDGAIPSKPQEIPLEGCQGAYTVSATLGDSKSVKFLVDTGSTTLAMPAKDCTTCQMAGVTAAYTPSTQGTNTMAGVSALYDTGELGWNGTVWNDSFQIDGTGPAVQIAFGAIDSETDFFNPISCDTATGMVDGSSQGILGFSTDEALIRGTTSFLDLLATAGLQNEFAMRLCHFGGSMWFGGFDSSAGKTGVQWAPLFGNHFGYYISVTGLEMQTATGNMKFSGGGHDVNGNTEMLIDSGGQFLLLPSSSYDSVVAALETNAYFMANFGSSFFVGNRSSNFNAVTLPDSPAVVDSMLPPLVVDIYGPPNFSISLPASETYLQYQHDGDNYDYIPNLFLNDLSSGILGNNIPFIYAGDVLMLSYITVFDRTNQRIGFTEPTAACP